MALYRINKNALLQTAFLAILFTQFLVNISIWSEKTGC